MKRKFKLIIIVMTPVTILLNFILKNSPGFVEEFYSTGLNKFTRQFQNLISGIFPFSIAEILFFSLIIVLFIMIIFLIIKIKRGGAVEQIINIFMYLSILYLLFMFLWGFNYNRYSFDKIAGFKIEKSSEADLKALCSELINKANLLRPQVEVDTKNVMTEAKGYKDVFNRVGKGYVKAAELYPELSGSYSQPKPIILSEPMCYTGITGIYIPYTGEANVNIKVEPVNLAWTTAHEMAHQRGFAREDEANFIAYLTCSLNPDKDIQYSGIVLALTNSMNALAAKDMDAYRDFRSQYCEGLTNDLTADTAFWNQYSGKIQKVANQVNNSYLKSNGQSDGTESYGRMVDLLLAQYRKTTN